MNTTVKCAFFKSTYTKLIFWMDFTAIITSVINTVTSAFAVVGNILIIYIIVKHKRLQNPSNILLGCLSLTDFLVGLIVQPLFVVRRSFEIQNIYICISRLTYIYFGYLCTGASVLIIAMISIDRCFAVLFPFRYEILADNQKYCLVMTGVWTAWTLFNLLSLTSVWNVLPPRPFLYGGMLIFTTSGIIVIVSYSLIYRVVSKLRRKIMPAEKTDEQNRRSKQRRHHERAKSLQLQLEFLYFATPLD